MPRPEQGIALMKARIEAAQKERSEYITRVSAASLASVGFQDYLATLRNFETEIEGYQIRLAEYERHWR